MSKTKAGNGSKKKNGQRPFLKGITYQSRAQDKASDNKRYSQWLCSSNGECNKTEEHTSSPHDYWRIFRIMAEFIDGFEFLSKLKQEVTFYGSTRAPKTGRYYKMAVELGKLCAEHGYTVITGGGPGIMEAGNKGAFEAGGESIGLDIQLPTEQRRNDYVTNAIGFHYFFTRKVMLSASSQAYVFFPGGFGTLDEATEMLVLVQTGKIPPNVPCIFIGKDYWQPFLKWIETTVLKKNGFIKKEDLALIRLVDSPKEAFEIIKTTVERSV